MRAKNVTMGRLGLVVSGAVLVMALGGLQSWAEEPANEDAVAESHLRMAQADGGSEAEAASGDSDEQAIPELTEEVLTDPEVIALGEEVWQGQCRSCHGNAAYPGKAPKLRPSRYEPDFVYHRVTFGFRGMPAWEDVYSEEERIAVTAYILSREFSP